MQIITTYPIWFTLLCAALSGLYVFILYFTGQRNRDLSSVMKWVLASIRFVVVFLIAFFLLEPLMKSIIDEKERPIVVIAQDFSESVVQSTDSSFYTKEYLRQLKSLQEQLSKDYEVKTFSFGDKVQQGLTESFNERKTDFSELFSEIDDRFYNTNLAAVLLASDGLFNKGNHPLYYPFEEKYPIYTIGLGDTTSKTDLFFLDTKINEFAFLGNTFPLQALVGATNLKGKKSTVQLWNSGKKLQEIAVDITADNFDATINFKVKSSIAGVQKYTLKIVPLDNEFNTINNTIDLYIDVLDNRQKILLLAGAPHPDIGAILSAIEKKENYEAIVQTTSKFDGNLEAYSLIIGHNIDQRTGKKALEKIKSSKVPFWLITGTQSSLKDAMNIMDGISYNGGGGATENYNTVLNPSFGWFEISDELKKNGASWPPLFGPFGDINISQAWNSIYNKQIGSVSTNKPLFLFNRSERKQALLAAEGIWRWKMMNYRQQNDVKLFDELIGKTIQLLSVKDDKRRFKVTADKQLDENENLKFTAQLYNESYELINEPEVNLILTNEKGEQFDFNFQPFGSSYQLEAGVFPPGTYQYTSSTSWEGEQFSESGSLTIKSIAIESSVLTADHNLLFQLSEKTGGESLTINDLSGLEAKLEARDDIQTVVYQQKILDDLINNKWLFFLVLVLLSIEWFVRKRSGLY